MRDVAEQPAHAPDPTDGQTGRGTAPDVVTDGPAPDVADAAATAATATDDVVAGPVTDDRPTPDAAVRPGRPLAAAVLVLVALAGVAIDVVTKQLVVAHLREGSPVRLLGGAVYLVLTRNGGAAFSMGTGVTWVFPAIALVVIGAIVTLGFRLRSLAWAVALGLVAGGALGNLIDRLFRAPGAFRGQVVDFISLGSDRGAGFAIFNAADSALVCGVALALLLELTGRRRDGSRVRH